MAEEMSVGIKNDNQIIEGELLCDMIPVPPDTDCENIDGESPSPNDKDEDCTDNISSILSSHESLEIGNSEPIVIEDALFVNPEVKEMETLENNLSQLEICEAQSLLQVNSDRNLISEFIEVDKVKVDVDESFENQSDCMADHDTNTDDDNVTDSEKIVPDLTPEPMADNSPLLVGINMDNFEMCDQSLSCTDLESQITGTVLKDTDNDVKIVLVDNNCNNGDSKPESDMTSNVGTVQLFHENSDLKQEMVNSGKNGCALLQDSCDFMSDVNTIDGEGNAGTTQCDDSSIIELKPNSKSLKSRIVRSEPGTTNTGKQTLMKAHKNKILSIISNNKEVPKNDKRQKYTIEELKKLRDSPLSQVKPDCLDNAHFKPSGLWDPFAYIDKKDGNHSTEQTTLKHRKKGEKEKKNLDPKSRIKEESDGIVLSPQRRSFFLGCNINMSTNKSNLEHSERSILEREPHRDVTSRRIGSGRIVRERDSDKAKDYGYGRKDRKERFDKDERFDKKHMLKDKHLDRDMRCQRKRRDDTKPEWFSGGPTSQHDTIELKGFEDEISEERDKLIDEQSKMKGHSESYENKSNDSSGIKAMLNDLKIARSSPDTKDKVFDFNDFFKLDSVPGVLQTSDNAEVQESRFRQWFKSSSPTNERISENLTSGKGNDDQNKSIDIFEMLDKAGKEANFNKVLLSNNGASIRELAVQGKLKSVQELEADIKSTLPNDKSEEQCAFKKLLAQMSDGKAVTGHFVSSEKSPRSKYHDIGMSYSKPMDNLGIGVLFGQNSEEKKSPLIQSKSKHPVGFKSNHSVSPLPADLQVTINQTALSADLLQRTEAQAIITGLATGQFTRQHILHQLQNSGLQQRTRDILLNILKLQQHGLPASVFQRSSTPPNLTPMVPTCVSPEQGLYQSNRTPSPHASFNQSSNLINRMPATLNPQGIQRRVPSPKELAVHTQQIYQNALLKRKLVEQNENYRKRQELQQSMPHRGGGDSSPVKSPNLLSFTPTSVMRKRAAEKDKLSVKPDILKEAGDGASCKPIGDKTSSPEAYMVSKMSPENFFRPVNGFPNNKVSLKDQLLKGFPRNIGHSINVTRGYEQTRPENNNLQQRSLLGTYNRPGLNNIPLSHNVGIAPPSVNHMNIPNAVLDMRLPVNVGQTNIRPIPSPVTSLTGQPSMSLLNSYGDVQRRPLDSRQMKYSSTNTFKNRPPTPLLEQPYRHSHLNTGPMKNMHGLSRPLSAGTMKTSPQNQLALLFGDKMLSQTDPNKLQIFPPVPTQKAMSLEEVERLQVVRN